MSRLPRWIQITKGPYVENGKCYVNFRIRTRDPLFWAELWRLTKQRAQQNGWNPYRPMILWAYSKLVMRLIVKGKS